MNVFADSFDVSTKGNSDTTNITENIQQAIKKSKITEGIALVFISGSTAAISAIEYESGLLKDFPRALEKIAPKDAPYAHSKRWGCDNGSSHVKSTIIGPSLTIPITSGTLDVGKWQQIVLIDFDTRPRQRTVKIKILGS